MMRNTRRKRWIERVEIQRDVDRTVQIEWLAWLILAHRHDLHAKTVCLLALVRVHGANAHLHEPRRQSLLQDPREWAGMRSAAALELIIQIRVSINMQNRHARMHR